MEVYCAHHPQQPATGTCAGCGRLACGDCLVDLNGQTHCKPCLTARLRPAPRRISGFFRLVLSVVPGLGHLYMGLFNRGLQLTVGTALGAMVIAFLIPPLLGLWLPLAVVFSIFDAREAHLRLAQGLEVHDLHLVDFRAHWNPRWLAYGLIALGILALYNTFVSDVLRLLFPYWPQYYQVASLVRTLTLAVLAIAAGVWLLRQSAPGSAPSHKEEEPS